MTTPNAAAVGFIGLGLMGAPMARNLKTAGVDLVVHNRSRRIVDALAAEGMRAAPTPQAVAAAADTIILMLTDTAAVETVLFGDDGVLAGLCDGALVIDMGTTKALATREFAGRIAAAGGAYVDAPVSGGEVGAKAATLTIMAGGDAAAVDRALPLLRILGGAVTHVGPVGSGQVAKSANQAIVGLTIGAVAEALILAKRAGADPAKVREALLGGFAASRILELHGQRMIAGTFAPGGRVTTQRKDVADALELAEAVGAKLPALTLSLGLWDELIAAGHGALDHSALIKAIDPET